MDTAVHWLSRTLWLMHMHFHCPLERLEMMGCVFEMMAFLVRTAVGRPQCILAPTRLSSPPRLLSRILDGMVIECGFPIMILTAQHTPTMVMSLTMRYMRQEHIFYQRFLEGDILRSAVLPWHVLQLQVALQCTWPLDQVILRKSYLLTT